MSQRCFVVIVGYEFSELGEEALRIGISFAKGASKAELHVAHVVSPPAVTSELGPTVALEGLLDDARERIATRLERARLPPSIRATAHVSLGDAGRELPELAQELQADLIILGTHGRKGLQRMLLGSVAEQVVRRAPCSVMCVKLRPEAVRHDVEEPWVDWVLPKAMPTR
jgi:nucleotide-binding universal stress UspA family protein